eukprot:Ihof_evm4s49 gene=Ihof_evmTU4s49
MPPLAYEEGALHLSLDSMPPLVVPIALWGSHLPHHHVTAVHVTTEQRVIATGTSTGQICLWTYELDNETYQLQPHILLLGHASTVTSLASVVVTREGVDVQALASVSDDGAVMLWDTKDGRCLVSGSPLPRGPSKIKTMESHRQLVCWGTYSQIILLETTSLQVMCTLCCEARPDWTSTLCCFPMEAIQRQPDGDSEALLTITLEGVLKLWSLELLHDSTLKDSHDPLWQPLRIQVLEGVVRPSSIAVNPFTRALLLVVCADAWRLYTAGDFQLVCCVQASNVGNWIGGEFVKEDTVVVWGEEGRSCLYQIHLPSDLPVVAFSSNSTSRFLEGTPGEQVASSTTSGMAELVGILNTNQLDAHLPTGERAVFHPKLCYARPSGLQGDRQGHLVASADEFGVVRVWNLPLLLANLMQSECHIMVPTAICEFRSAWTDPQGGDHVTASILVENTSLVRGYDTGIIVVSDVVDEIDSLTTMGHFSTSFSSIKRPHYNRTPEGEGSIKAMVLAGHTARITCLLYPQDTHPDFPDGQLLSGSADFTIRVWNIRSGQPLHVFNDHSGMILRLVSFPNSSSARPRYCVCSVANDHSVGIYSLEDMKCIQNMGGHRYPVRSVQWRYDDDYFMVETTDGAIYIWQLGTGHLDRVAYGQLAEDILSSWSNTHNARDMDVDASLSCNSNKARLCDGLRFSTALVGVWDNPKYLASTLPMTQPTAITATVTNTRRSHSLMKLVSIPLNDSDPPLEVLLLDVKRIVTANRYQGESDGSELLRALAALLQSELLPWGLNAELDQELTRLTVQTPSRHCSFGMMGHGGHMSFMLPHRCHSKTVWQVSAYATALRMASSMILTYQVDPDASRQLARYFTYTLPTLLPQSLQPSIFLLMHYWQDSTVMNAVHQLLDARIVAMGDYDLQAEIKKWLPCVLQDMDHDVTQISLRMPPTMTGPCNNSVASISVLILALLASRYPMVMDQRTCKAVAQKLQAMALNVESTGSKDAMIRMSAANLLAEGFGIWKHYLDVGNLLLYALALTQPPSLTTTSLTTGPSSNSAAMVRIFYLVLKKIAVTSSRIFMATISRQFNTSHSVGERIHAIRMVCALIKDVPHAFTTQLPRLVDVVVRSLDPHVPQLRDSCLEDSTKTLQEIVKQYMMVSFHAPSQKLAVGSSVGLIVLYDLKTARRCQEIESNQADITALAISNDGGSLASYSSKDLTLCFWKTSISFFNILSNSPKCLSTHK